MSEVSAALSAEDAVDLPAVAPAVELEGGSAGDAAAAADLPPELDPPPPPPLLDDERETPASRLLLLPSVLDAAGSFPVATSLRESASAKLRKCGCEPRFSSKRGLKCSHLFCEAEEWDLRVAPPSFLSLPFFSAEDGALGACAACEERVRRATAPPLVLPLGSPSSVPPASPPSSATTSALRPLFCPFSGEAPAGASLFLRLSRFLPSIASASLLASTNKKIHSEIFVAHTSTTSKIFCTSHATQSPRNARARRRPTLADPLREVARPLAAPGTPDNLLGCLCFSLASTTLLCASVHHRKETDFDR